MLKALMRGLTCNHKRQIILHVRLHLSPCCFSTMQLFAVAAAGLSLIRPGADRHQYTEKLTHALQS